jgi:hypothetical protein
MAMYQALAEKSESTDPTNLSCKKIVDCIDLTCKKMETLTTANSEIIEEAFPFTGGVLAPPPPPPGTVGKTTGRGESCSTTPCATMWAEWLE